MNSIVKDVIASLEAFKDPNRIAFASKSYPTSMRVIGVTNPNSKTVLNELKALTKNYSGREKIDLAKSLFDTNIFECQHIAFEYIGKDKKALKELTAKDVQEFCVNMDNWVSVDCYAGYILGYAWREGVVTTEKVKSFLKSDDFWSRRIAVVATVALNQKARGGKGDAKKTLEICELVIDDHHDMMNKALSWVLRELAKIEKEPVIDFIQKNQNRLHKRVLREVKNKLDTGKKY
jgi:3-methyladenine DNA glycosylase AlkD